MSSKLQVGDIIRIKKSIEHEQKSYSWKTGYYQLIRIGNMMSNGVTNPKMASYTFEKIRKDGSVYATPKWFGYDARAFDKMDIWEKQ